MLRGLCIAVLLLLQLPAAGQDAPRVMRLDFAPGAQARVINQSIAGFETIDYVVALREGDALAVTLDSTNLSNCFDISEPGAEKPFFVGGQSGNHHEFRATADGEYVIRVYLLRFAARDYQSADYRLTVVAQPVARNAGP